MAVSIQEMVSDCEEFLNDIGLKKDYPVITTNFYIGEGGASLCELLEECGGDMNAMVYHDCYLGCVLVSTSSLLNSSGKYDVITKYIEEAVFFDSPSYKEYTEAFNTMEKLK